jgi:hypothetical protein
MEGRTYDTSRSHLLIWLHKIGKLYCIISHDFLPFETAHIVQRKCPVETRVRIYKALGGWFTPHSCINLIPLMNSFHHSWDTSGGLLFYLHDRKALDSVRDYLDFLDGLPDDGTALDYLSLLRLYHNVLVSSFFH